MCAGQLAQVDLPGPPPFWLPLALTGYSSEWKRVILKKAFLFLTSVPFADNSDDGVKLYTSAGYPVEGQVYYWSFFNLV